MDKVIEELRETKSVPKTVRLLEECRALLERLATGEPAPEGCTFQSWAEDLLK